MNTSTRREFLVDLSRSLLLVGMGPSVVSNKGFALAAAGDDDRLDFGELEPLVGLMQETEPDRLLEILVAKLRAGAELRRLVAAGALANARTFGGQNYNGYHAFMALTPSLEMAHLQPARSGERRALPVLKVLHRNTGFIQDAGGRSQETLRRLATEEVSDVDPRGGEVVRQASRAGDMDAAERSFAAAFRGSPLDAYEHLQATVHDDVNVHRIVLAWRAWGMIDLVGEQHAHTLLRQSLRFCVDAEQSRVRRGRAEPSLRELLPTLLDEHGLAVRRRATRRPDDALVEELADTIFAASREQAAKAMAAALAEGYAPMDLGECLSLAGNKLLLHDPGRAKAAPGKPIGSVHGASVGVHASDAARAWRNVASVLRHENAVASLIVGAYHAGGQSEHVGQKPFPWTDALADLSATDPDELLAELGPAVEASDQALACALVHRYGEFDAPAGPVFDLLLRYGTRADGALHAEKYFSTVHQEFREARPVFRGRHLLGLTRVTASEQGFPSAGWDQARQLLSS